MGNTFTILYEGFVKVFSESPLESLVYCLLIGYSGALFIYKIIKFIYTLYIRKMQKKDDTIIYPQLGDLSEEVNVISPPTIKELHDLKTKYDIDLINSQRSTEMAGLTEHKLNLLEKIKQARLKGKTNVKVTKKELVDRQFKNELRKEYKVEKDTTCFGKTMYIIDFGIEITDEISTMLKKYI